MIASEVTGKRPPGPSRRRSLPSWPLGDEHEYMVSRDSSPRHLGRDHQLVGSKVVDTAGSGQWEGRQIIAIYARPDFVAPLMVTLGHLHGEISLDNAVDKSPLST